MCVCVCVCVMWAVCVWRISPTRGRFILGRCNEFKNYAPEERVFGCSRGRKLEHFFAIRVYGKYIADMFTVTTPIFATELKAFIMITNYSR